MANKEKKIDFAREYIKLCKKYNVYIANCCCSFISDLEESDKLVLDRGESVGNKSVSVDVISVNHTKDYLTEEFEIY